VFLHVCKYRKWGKFAASVGLQKAKSFWLHTRVVIPDPLSSGSASNTPGPDPRYGLATFARHERPRMGKSKGGNAI